MITAEIDHTTGLPRVEETRTPRVRDPRAGCNCPQNRCRWRELPKQPWQQVLHDMQASNSGWTPQYQTWVDGKPTSVLCWKCGREIKGFKPVLTIFGQAYLHNGQPAVQFGLHSFYRAKTFEVYLPTLDETATIDALHCADCHLDTEDSEKVTAIWLAGLIEAHREGLRLAEQIQQKPAFSAHDVATYFSRWTRAEGLRALHRDAGDDTHPSWRS